MLDIETAALGLHQPSTSRWIFTSARFLPRHRRCLSRARDRCPVRGPSTCAPHPGDLVREVSRPRVNAGVEAGLAKSAATDCIAPIVAAELVAGAATVIVTNIASSPATWFSSSPEPHHRHQRSRVSNFQLGHSFSPSGVFRKHDLPPDRATWPRGPWADSRNFKQLP